MAVTCAQRPTRRAVASGRRWAVALCCLAELFTRQRLPPRTMQNRPNASINFVLVTLGLDALGVGLIAPIVPALVQQLTHLPAQDAAPWVGALIASYAAMQFFAAPLLAELSDRFGRRPVILASVFGLGCDYVLLTFAPNLWWLFAGRLVAGATSANVAAATAYIADVSAKDDRAKLSGLVGATFGAGFVIGPALGGLLGQFGLRLPFIAAAALSFLNACFGLFVLPESLPPENRRPFQLGKLNPFAQLVGVWRDAALGRLALAWSCTWIGLGAVHRLPVPLGFDACRAGAGRYWAVASGGRGSVATVR